MDSSSRDNYVATLSEAVIENALLILQRMNGTLASDLWPADQGHDEVAEEASYAMLAEEWKSLEPESTLSIWDAAEVWVREFKNEILGIDRAT